MSKEISLATVKEHNKPEDLWVIIENKVYDLTKFLNEVSNNVIYCNGNKLFYLNCSILAARIH